MTMRVNKTILFSIAVSIALASDNPFSVDQSMQKIEKEESSFLKELKSNNPFKETASPEEKKAREERDDGRKTAEKDQNGTIEKVSEAVEIKAEEESSRDSGSKKRDETSLSIVSSDGNKSSPSNQHMDLADKKVGMLEERFEKTSEKDSRSIKKNLTEKSKQITGSSTENSDNSEFEKALEESIKSVND